jgi:diguanylate cyclase (GGDEF)-like protein
VTSPEEATRERVEEVESLVRYEARKALTLARDMLAEDVLAPDDVLYQRLRLAKASAQARVGETADGARLLREVKVWAETHDETTLLAMSHRRLSMLFRRVGDPALMLEHAVTAVELLEEDCAPALRGDHLLGLADALGASGEFDSSIRRYHEAGELAETCDDVYLRHAVLNNLSYTQFEAGLSEAAVATAERLLEQTAAHGQALMSHNADTVARAYMSVGRYAEAAAVLEPFCQDEESEEDCDGVALGLLTLAEAKRLGGDLESAQEALDRAGVLIEKFGLEGRRPEVMREQGELFAATGDHEAAFHTYKAFHAADVEIRALQRDGRARTLNAIFEATEAQRSRDFFRELAVRDPLTGLHNRRHLDASMAELLAGLRTGTESVTVGLVDLDHFKRVNDTYSHAVGDTVLQRVAGLLEQAAASVEDGIAARMGGEEFVLVLPHLTRDAAVPRFEALRRSIAEQPWAEVTAGLSVTASVGIGSAPEDGLDKAEILAEADRNLYRAKRAGRDRVVAQR